MTKQNFQEKELTQEIVDSFSVIPVVSSPKEIKDYFYQEYGYGFDAFHSVVLIDNSTKQIYGYILAHYTETIYFDISRWFERGKIKDKEAKL